MSLAGVSNVPCIAALELSARLPVSGILTLMMTVFMAHVHENVRKGAEKEQHKRQVRDHMGPVFSN